MAIAILALFGAVRLGRSGVGLLSIASSDGGLRLSSSSTSSRLFMGRACCCCCECDAGMFHGISGVCVEDDDDHGEEAGDAERPKPKPTGEGA